MRTTHNRTTKGAKRRQSRFSMSLIISASLGPSSLPSAFERRSDSWSSVLVRWVLELTGLRMVSALAGIFGSWNGSRISGRIYLGLDSRIWLLRNPPSSFHLCLYRCRFECLHRSLRVAYPREDGSRPCGRLEFKETVMQRPHGNTSTYLIIL